MDPTRAFGGIAHSAVEKVRTNSAVNPLLWLCGIALPLSLIGTFWFPPHLSNVCITIATLVVVAPILAYGYLLFTDPDRLQSETYQLERRRMEMLGDDRMLGKPAEALIVEGGNTSNTARALISAEPNKGAQ